MNVSAKVHADPGTLRVTSVVVKLPQGGEMGGRGPADALAADVGASSGMAAPTPAPVKTTPRKKRGLSSHSSKPEAPAPKRPPISQLVKNSDPS